MAIGKTPLAKKFFRAALRRFETARFLIDKGEYTTDAVYLGGYALECMFKSLILSSEAEHLNRKTVKHFKDRGARSHDYDSLREQLAHRGILFPPFIVRILADVNWWTTSLRYDPVVLRRRDAESFLRNVEKLMTWIKGKL